MIEIEDVCKRFGNLAAVDHLNLKVPPGLVFGFLGPNGAGKTTTLRMLAGLLKPDEGRVRLGGVDMAERPEEAKALLGYVPDKPSLYPQLTGRETLRLVAGLYGLDKDSAEKRIGELLSGFELAGWGDERVGNYSHGMRQKLAVSAALLHQPSVYIFDEPMVGLDPKGSRLIKNLFRRLADAGQTVFLSIHTLEVAESLCDRLAILFNGRLLMEGSPQEIRRRAGEENGRTLEQAFLALTGEEPDRISAEGFL